MSSIETVRAELGLYEHPFFEFSAEDHPDGVRVLIRSRIQTVHTPEFTFVVSDREAGHPQFRWSFQGLLYGSMNDFMIELFTRVPGDRA
jgi:hypothetical protein